MTKMRPLVFVLFALAACTKENKTASPAQRSGPPPAAAQNLPPDASHEELERAVESVIPDPQQRSNTLLEMAASSKQIFAWQTALNASRSADHRLRFDRNQKGIPIEEPMSYNADSVVKEYRDAIAALNPELRAVILNPSVAPPASINTSDEDFEKLAGKVLKAYDHAMRWESLSPFLEYYRGRINVDVRGYYFLSKVKDLNEKLSHWKDRSSDEAKQLDGWLKGLCRNGADAAPGDCAKELADDEARGNVQPFFDKHSVAGRDLMEWFFTIVETRTDMSWYQEEALNGPVVPFTKPPKEEVATLAKTLIEAAWKGAGWQLRLSFTDRSDADTTHLIFVPGALPHVNKLAGSEITMDDNIPADNEVNTSVFQHEFGHVLGFPDCYVEFYDDDAQAMVNYQIDVNNIMCSRAGKVSELHRDAIRKAYDTMPAPRLPSSKASRKQGAAPAGKGR